MKASQDISGYYEELCDSFIKHIHKCKKLNHEAIHDIRVVVKHLRALLKLIHSINKKSQSEKILSLIKPLYRAAGEHRTLELNIIQLKKYSFKALYLSRLKKQLKSADKELKHELKTFDLKLFKQIQNKASTNHNGFSDEAVTQKALSSSDGILIACQKTIKRKTISDEQLHEVRKDLKTIKSNLQLLLHINKNNKLFKGQLKKITEAEEIVGDWHDKAVLFKSINQIEKSTALEKLKKENNLLKSEVVKRLNRILK